MFIQHRNISRLLWWLLFIFCCFFPHCFCNNCVPDSSVVGQTTVPSCPENQPWGALLYSHADKYCFIGLKFYVFIAYNSIIMMRPSKNIQVNSKLILPLSSSSLRLTGTNFSKGIYTWLLMCTYLSGRRNIYRSWMYHPKSIKSSSINFHEFSVRFIFSR